MKTKIIIISSFLIILVIASIFLSYSNFNYEGSNTNVYDFKLDILEHEISLINEVVGNITINNSKLLPQLKGDKLSIYNIDNKTMLLLEEFCTIYNIEWNYDKFEGTIELNDKYNTYYLLNGTSVIAKDGIYLPYESKVYVDKDDNVYLDLYTIENVFNYKYFTNGNDEYIEVFDFYNFSPTDNEMYLDFENQFPNMTVEDMVEYLSFLSVPLQGAYITSRDSQMPGAPRDYRNGTHEGIDWYGGVTGINIDKSTPILSMADGIVVRADHNYVEYNEKDREYILNAAANSIHTPEFILDGLRGRTVWIQYDQGVIVRYAHLSRIEEDIKVGKLVKSGETIGYVGNSGTSYGIEGNNIGLHLHSDILIYNNLFWEYFDRNQIRTILETLFPR